MTYKVQFGSGHNCLDGWDNRDIETDIRLKLPFDNNIVDFVFAEHVIEHINTFEGIRFLFECNRIMKVGGVIRIAFPNIAKVWHYDQPNHRRVIDIISKWGHRSVWSDDIALTLLKVTGFQPYQESYGHSRHIELKDIEGHHKVLGKDGLRLAMQETTIFEGTKI